MGIGGKNPPREQRNGGAQRILRGSSLFSFLVLPFRIIPLSLSLLPRPRNGRDGNCVKVDVGYVGRSRPPISVRGIINSRQRTVTKVRACRLVSRSVSVRVDFPSPSSFRRPSSFFFFPLYRPLSPLFLTRKSSNRSERNNSPADPVSSASITALLVLSPANVRMKFPNAIPPSSYPFEELGKIYKPTVRSSPFYTLVLDWTSIPAESTKWPE